jgi:hypothetical protein
MVQAYTGLPRQATRTAWRPGSTAKLAGGLYCVALGRAVFGESMFTHQTDASKIALAALVALVPAFGVPMIDCQQNTRPPGLAGRARNQPGGICRTVATARQSRSRAGSSSPYTGIELLTPNARPTVTHLKDLPAADAAVLCNGALPLQLPAGQAGPLAGGHAQPPDPQRRLLGPRDQRLPAQRHVHLPPLLRRLPRLRAAARAWSTASSPRAASAAPGSRTTCRRACSSCASCPSTTSSTCATRPAATRAAAWTTTASTSTRSSCCKAGSTRGWWSSAKPARRQPGALQDGVHPRRAERRHFGGLHLLRARTPAPATAPTACCGRSSRPRSSTCRTSTWATGSRKARR